MLLDSSGFLCGVFNNRVIKPLYMSVLQPSLFFSVYIIVVLLFVVVVADVKIRSLALT